MNSRNDQNLDRFEQELRRWGNRPPLTPPEAAVRLVVSSLKPRHAGLPIWRMAAAAAVAVLMVCGSWIGLRISGGSVPQPLPYTEAARSTGFVPPPLDENVVLWWLDDETPVYFVLNTGDKG